MPHLQIHPERVTPEAARLLTALCPFGAIQYTAGSLDITAGCKMCRMCVNKGPAGVIDVYKRQGLTSPVSWPYTSVNT